MDPSLKRRVVVTGLGAITPLGNNIDATWSGLMAGRSGAGPITRFDSRDFAVHFACEVKGFDPIEYIDKDKLATTGTYTQYAIAASDEALADSGLKITPANAGRIGTFISVSIGDFAALEAAFRKFAREGPSTISPDLANSIYAFVPSHEVRARNGIKGPALATATACAAGNHAIGDSFRLIQRGQLDVMICGGSETPVTQMMVGGFSAMRALSQRNADPQGASRPFDRGRDGFVLGEGSGILILEELEHAMSRGARIYAELAGYDMTGDAFHITMPDETQDGAIRVMCGAIADAGICRESITYVNAHGTSTPLGDKNETLAIRKAFGPHASKLAISSTKSMTGHLLGAAGGVEAVFTVLALHHQKVPPTINYTTPDPDCDLDFVPNQARPMTMEYALSNGFGFGGTNTALVFRRFGRTGHGSQ